MLLVIAENIVVGLKFPSARNGVLIARKSRMLRTFSDTNMRLAACRAFVRCVVLQDEENGIRAILTRFNLITSREDSSVILDLRLKSTMPLLKNRGIFVQYAINQK